MKKSMLFIIVSLMSVALLSLIGLQFYFIRESLLLKSKLFDQSVMDALNKVASRLDKENAISIIVNKIIDDKSEQLENLNKHLTDPSIEQSEQYFDDMTNNDLYIQQEGFNSLSKRTIEKDGKKVNIFTSQSVVFFRQFNQNEKSGKLLVRSEKINRGRNFESQLNNFFEELNFGSNLYLYDSIANDLFEKISMMIKLNPNDVHNRRLLQNIVRMDRKKRINMINQYIDSLNNLKQENLLLHELVSEIKNAQIPIYLRVEQDNLEEIIEEEFKNKNIGLKYDYGLYNFDCDQLIFANSESKFTDTLRQKSNYEVTLFPASIPSNRGVLTLSFPEKQGHLWMSMDVIMSSSFGLLLLMLVCFGYTIFVILRQKKISKMKNDFINNMTHEFKTPVSTIMLASEALADSNIDLSKDKVKKLAHVIFDENERLANNIEQVLTITKLDRKEIVLNRKKMSINELIEHAKDSMSLQLQKAGAVIDMKLNVADAVVYVDELHMSNVILNLLENAIKYCKRKPRILITTDNKDNKISIKIKDNGVGIPKKALQHIFDKFYRVHTGNVHNVKGFGLGLSYVYHIVNKHGGSVKVKSEVDVGSEFEIILPR